MYAIAFFSCQRSSEVLHYPLILKVSECLLVQLLSMEGVIANFVETHSNGRTFKYRDDEPCSPNSSGS